MICAAANRRHTYDWASQVFAASIPSAAIVYGSSPFRGRPFPKANDPRAILKR